LWPSVPTLNLSPEAESHAAFTITSSRDWTIECSAGWLTVNPFSATGDSTVTVTAAANNQNSGRQATLRITTRGREQNVVVNQASLKPHLSVSASALTIGGGEDSKAVFDINSNTAWTIDISYVADPLANQMFMMGSGNWLTVSEDAGVNSGTISLSAAVNPVVNKRAANITVSADGVKPFRLTVTQEEGAPSLVIRSDTVKFDSEGGSASPLYIRTNTTWTLKCSEEWINASPETGGNFSQVTITAKENTNPSERKGEIIFTVPGLDPKIIVITQKSAPDN
jgi:hypothetical protein